MSDPVKPRARCTLWIRVLLVVCTALMIASVWFGLAVRSLRNRVHGLEIARDRWERAQEDRPPVRGAGRPGNAWESYRDACRGLAAGPFEVPEDQGSAGPPGELVRVLDAIGVGAERIRFKLDLEQFAVEALQSVSHDLLRLLRWSASFEVQQGRPGRALRRGLDVAWFGTDLLRVGRSNFTTYGRRTLRGALRILAELVPDLREEHRSSLRSTLIRLETTLPSIAGTAMEQERWHANFILDGTEVRWGEPRTIPRHLRFRVNQPFYIADLPAILDRSEQQRDAAEASWLAARRLANEFDRRPTFCGSVGIKLPFPDHGGLIESHYYTLAMLRLLIAAASPPEQAAFVLDPFTDDRAALQRRRDAGSVVFWSVGPDAVDDGGRAPPRGYRGTTRDLVLVVPDRKR